MLKANEILSQLTPASGYSYYIYFCSGNTAEYIQFNNAVGIMTHYCDNTSKRYTQFPCMYRPSTTYPSFRQFTYANGTWTDNGTKGSSTSHINRTAQGASITAIAWLNGLDWIYGNTNIIVYDNNTNGDISTVSTFQLSAVPEEDEDILGKDESSFPIYRANNIKAAYASKLSDPNQVCGTQQYCTIQGSNDWWYRTFLQYDLSGIPMGSTIRSAKMYVYCYYWNDNGGSGTTNIARITTDWDESTLCWNNQPDFEDRYLAMNMYAPHVNSWAEWDITSLVQEWCNGTHPNYGLYIINNNEGAYRVNWDIYNYRYDLANSNDGDDSNNLGTYLLIEYDPDTPSEPVKGPYEELIDFTKENWKTQRTDIITVTDGATPFFVDSTYTYNNEPTLRSGIIGHYGVTNTTFTVNYIEAGAVKFKYRVSSEGPDYLRVYVDDTRIISVSGTSMASWETCTYDVSAGTHTIKFEYTKDGSVVTGLDAGAIAQLKFIGVMPPFPTRHLVQDLQTGKYYANIDGTLSVVDLNAEPSFQDFINYGGDLPTSGMLKLLSHFRVLKCAGTTEYSDFVPKLHYSIVGNVRPRIFKCTRPILLTEPHHIGFKSINMLVTKLDTTDIRILLSPDNNSWMKYIPPVTEEVEAEDGTMSTEIVTPGEWITSDLTEDVIFANGMTIEEVSALDEYAFALMHANYEDKRLYLAFSVKCTELDYWCVSSIKVAFATT